MLRPALRWTLLAQARDSFEISLFLACRDGTGTNHSLCYGASYNLGDVYAAFGLVAEAVVSYDNSAHWTLNLKEQARSLVQKAAIYSAFGSISESNEILMTSVRYSDSDVSTYLPIVINHKILNNLTRKDWISIIETMESTLQSQIRLKGALGIMDNGLPVWASFGTDIYWALFEAYDAIGNYSQAWKYRERAQKISGLTTQNAFTSIVLNDDELMDHILENLKNYKYADIQEEYSTGSEPVFIIGFPG